MKILIIDPRCVDFSSTYYYVTGLASGLSKCGDVTLAAVKECHIGRDAEYKLKKIFYPISQKMGEGILRKIIRGCEYIWAYIYLLIYTRINRFDSIHIEWPIVYGADKVFFKLLKKNTKLFTLKAHNVLPHSTGNSLVEIFRELYAIPDKIILHGEGMKSEFLSLFPEYESKVVMQRHGIYTGHDISFLEELVDMKIKERINSYKRIYLFCGRIDEDKGVDRLVRIWKDELDKGNSLLVIAGKVASGYSTFSEVEVMIESCNHILYQPGYIEDNLLNYLLSKAALIIMPYKQGSMSGVAFTASEFSKPILTTRFGSIEEYVLDGQTGYVVENEDLCIASKLAEIDNSVADEDLKLLGARMHSYFEENYQWNHIAEKLYNEVYAKLI